MSLREGAGPDGAGGDESGSIDKKVRVVTTIPYSLK